MFKQIFQKLFSSEKARLQAENERLRIEKTLAEEAAERLRAEKELAEQTRQEEEAKRDAERNGTTPWVEIKSANFDEVKGFRIELDWNQAFIQHLKESGLKGKSDEEIVQKWLGFLYGDIVDRLEQTVIERNSTKTTNDFM